MSWLFYRECGVKIWYFHLIVMNDGSLFKGDLNVLSKNKLAKLSNADRGPYQVFHSTSQWIYDVRKLLRSDNPVVKYMDYDLYPLLSF